MAEKVAENQKSSRKNIIYKIYANSHFLKYKFGNV